MSSLKCDVCGKSLNDNDFQVDEQGHPLWWIDPRFHPEIKHPIHFCNASHSTEWYNTNILKKQSPESGLVNSTDT